MRPMGNLIDMEDINFPDPEVMADWLRRNREAPAQLEELQLPLPVYPDKSGQDRPQEPTIIQLS